MKLDFTLNKFPITGALKDECSLPFACVIQPFAPFDEQVAPGRLAADALARCSSCYAYINHYCHFGGDYWSCALCGHENDLSSVKGRRYARPQIRRQLQELQEKFYEAQCSIKTEPQLQNGNVSKTRPEEAQQVCIALVDLSCNEEFLELVQSSILAALESMPKAARFGLVTFSTKVGLYDTQGKEVVVHYVSLVEGADESPTPLDLRDALPLNSLLTPVSGCKEVITQAVESMRPDTACPSDASLDTTAASVPKASRAFGGALQAVLRYIGSGHKASGPEGSNGTTGVNLMTFLAGPPNKGRGQVVKLHRVLSESQEKTAPLPDYEADLRRQNTPEEPAQPSTELGNGQPEVYEYHPDEGAKSFYEEAAVGATAVGACIDLFAISPFSCGLSILEPLAARTGGILYLYPQLEAASLPQDVYRRVSVPKASNGLLRIRTSPEFKVTKAYGQLFTDQQYDNLAHVVACDSASTFAFDFGFTRAAGFSAASDNPPMLQAVFQYSLPAPLEAEAVADGDEDKPATPRFSLQRRLRVLTMPLSVARSAQEVYENANSDAILVMLMHKICRAAIADGLTSARNLLQSWLTLTCARHNLARSITTQDPIKCLDQVDAALNWASGVQGLPRLVYALLRSPLFTDNTRGHPDARSAVRHLWAGLPPQLLRRVVYPALMSYKDPDTLATPNHALSREALIAAGAPIFLVDSFSMLLLYYAVGYPPHLQFPPPQNSLLRRTINAQRQSRRPTPSLHMIRGGIDNVQPFLDCLIEEAEIDEEGGISTPAYQDFVRDLKLQVWQYLQNLPDQ